jgi:small subunit ribosomal protein S8
VAKKSLIAKSGRPPKYATRRYSRCNRCGRLARARARRRRPGNDQVELVGEAEMMTDPVADMLARLKNANKALQETVSMPNSRLKEEIARLLKEEGYVKNYRVEKGEAFDTLVVELKFGQNRERVITDLKRVSKPGRRIYARKDRLPRVLGGMGTAILSTSSGIITSRRAQELGVGGEVICFVW